MSPNETPFGKFNAYENRCIGHSQEKANRLNAEIPATDHSSNEGCQCSAPGAVLSLWRRCDVSHRRFFRADRLPDNGALGLSRQREFGSTVARLRAYLDLRL